MNRFLSGLGQRADQLPPTWECFTEQQVEIAIGRALLEVRGQAKSKEVDEIIERVSRGEL